MLDDAQWNELAETFLSEAQDLIQRAEASLAELQQNLSDREAINDLFRAVHTLKGSSGLLGLDAVVAFTHEYESLLTEVRDGALLLDAELLRLCFHCLDRINDLIDSVAAGDSEDTDPARTQALMLELKEVRSAGGAPSVTHDAPAEGLERLDESQLNRDLAWHLSLRFDPTLFQNGFDPGSFLRYLEQSGEILDVICVIDDLPIDLDTFDPELCYCGFEVTLLADTSKAELEQVFEFVEDLSDIRILPPASRLEDYIRLIQSLPEDDWKLGEILINAGLLTPRELETGLGLQRDDGQRKLGEIMVDEHMVAPEAVQTALEKQKQVRERTGQGTYLRVPADKMDALINRVGELVIAAEGARLVAQQRGDEAFAERSEEVCRHVEAIRESALRLRMVEIGETFKRFHRLVRETSESLGKSVNLVINGGDTELDKAVVDRIYDPLVHLVRNAIDHGLETPDERGLAGKDPQGTVGLNAYHESGMIVIEVVDDGRGIDAQRVREKAVSQGLITPDTELGDQALLQMIFEPGFSTAAAVTNISGRGVGMDSVRRDIDTLRGTIEIDNRPGAGCTFRIRLPLTLAIIDGFLVSVADQFFVVPLELVTECIECPEDLSERQGDHFLELRGKPLPFIDLRHSFRIPGPRNRRQSLVVVRQGSHCAGLLVDALHGEIQTVIKPMGSLFEQLEGIGGASILGSGEVALILDVSGLIVRAGNLSRRTATSAVDNKLLKSQSGGVVS